MAQQEMDQPADGKVEYSTVGDVTVPGPPAAVNDKPAAFTMSIQGGMLEALGINMYPTLGKCLVEFVANALQHWHDRIGFASRGLYSFQEEKLGWIA
jgi:hypothetical protein